MDFKTAALLFSLLVVSLAMPKRDGYCPPYKIKGGSRGLMCRHYHMAAIYSGLGIRSVLSGGSLISRRTILTAAHCVNALYNDGSLSSTLRVIVNTPSWFSGGTRYEVERNVTHPNYNANLTTNDIALLITKSDIELSNSVRLVSLSFDIISAGVAARVGGWGALDVDGMLPHSLQELDVTTIDDQQCVTDVARAVIELQMYVPPVDPSTQLCTIVSDGHGVCHGDSGGPLIRIEDYRQIGIISWGFPCARGVPDIFTRISAYKEFIEANTVS